MVDDARATQILNNINIHDSRDKISYYYALTGCEGNSIQIARANLLIFINIIFAVIIMV